MMNKVLSVNSKRAEFVFVTFQTETFFSKIFESQKLDASYTQVSLRSHKIRYVKIVLHC